MSENPQSAPRFRATDDDRLAVLALLEKHYTLGSLDLAERDRRVARVKKSKFVDELPQFTADLQPLPEDETTEVTKINTASPVALFHRGLTRLHNAVVVLIVLLLATGMCFGLWVADRQDWEIILTGLTALGAFFAADYIDRSVTKLRNLL